MYKISNSIRQYYLNHFDELDARAQFHFASRLYLWSSDTEAESILQGLRPEFAANGDIDDIVQSLVTAGKKSPVFGARNAIGLRRPHFERYPMLKSYVTVLTRLLFLKTVYGIDARDLFYKYFPKKEVDDFAAQLASDYEAIAMLSTHAANFLYLYERFIKEDENSLNPELFLAAAQAQYDLSNRDHLQLLIYLYTHCIIAESLFYHRPLPAKYLPTYRQMAKELETLISNNSTNVNLDNKFEFLVASQLTGYKTSLAERIWQEAEASISPHGTFIIDRHNNNPRLNCVDLQSSEHRNVLCIMAGRQFTPRSATD